MTKKPKEKRLRKDEKEYIKLNCLIKTDEQIAKDLGRDRRSITKVRKKLGIQKAQGGRVIEMNASDPSNGNMIVASQRLTEEQRKGFFQTQFINTRYYENLKEQLTPEEIDFYLEEWGSLCVQFEDIVATEKRQIDELIKAEVMGNRMLRSIKITEEEIEKLIQDVEKLRKHSRIESDEELQNREEEMMRMVRTMYGESQAMANDYQRNVDLKNKLLNELNARRRDRIDSIKKSGITFLGLVQAFRDRDVREKQGRHMELVRMSKEKKKAEFRQPIQFPDGTKDCVLLDDESNIPQKDVVRLKDDLMVKYINSVEKNILIIDDDIKRIQFFQDKVGEKNKLDIASNPDKAKDKLKEFEYDFICLDYDLGLDKKGSEVVDYILSNDICKETDILIQSMNKDGSKIMFEALDQKRNVEVCDFSNLIKKFGEQNASNSISI